MPPLPGLVVLVLLRCKPCLSFECKVCHLFSCIAACNHTEHSEQCMLNTLSSALLLDTEACRRFLAFRCLCFCTAMQSLKYFPWYT